MSEERLKAAVAGESGLPRNASRMERARLALDRLEVAIARGFISARNRAKWVQNIESDPGTWLGLIPA